MYTIHSNYFCGNKVSDYGVQCGYVDYATLAKAFDAVLANDIMNKTSAADLGYWEPFTASEEYFEDSAGNTYDYSAAQDRIEELEEEQEETTDAARLSEIEKDLEELQDAHYMDIYQYYIISESGAEILKDYTNEIVYYNDELDLYVWCVTHYGTSWTHVLTDIKIELREDN